ncbi:hypothetical protein MBLNU230_g1199t1 [Neophaeotheca triangularis]
MFYPSREGWERIVVAICGPGSIGEELCGNTRGLARMLIINIIETMWKAKENRFKKTVAASASNGRRHGKLPDYELLSEHFSCKTTSGKIASILRLSPTTSRSETATPTPKAEAESAVAMPAEPEIELWGPPPAEVEEYDWKLYQMCGHAEDSNPPSPSSIPEAWPESSSFESTSTEQLDNDCNTYGVSFEQQQSTAHTTPDTSFGEKKPLYNEKGELDIEAAFANDPEWIRREARRERIRKGEELPFDVWVGRRRPRASPQEVVDKDLPVPWDLWNEKERNDYLFHTTRHESYIKDGVSVVKGFKIPPRQMLQPPLPKQQPTARRQSLLARNLRKASMPTGEHKVRFTVETKGPGVFRPRIDHPREHHYKDSTGLPASYYGSAPISKSFMEAAGKQMAGVAASYGAVYEEEDGADANAVTEQMTRASNSKGKAPATDVKDIKHVKIVTSAEAESAIESDDEDEDEESAWESVAPTPENLPPQPTQLPPAQPEASKKRTLSTKVPKSILKKQRPVFPKPPASPPGAEKEETYTLAPTKQKLAPETNKAQNGPRFPETPKSMRVRSPEVVDSVVAKSPATAAVTVDTDIKSASWKAGHIEMVE